MSTRPLAESKRITVWVLNGPAIKRRRIELGLTLKQVAARAGFSVSFLCDLEFERRVTSKETAERILEVLR